MLGFTDDADDDALLARRRAPRGRVRASDVAVLLGTFVAVSGCVAVLQQATASRYAHTVALGKMEEAALDIKLNYDYDQRDVLDVIPPACDPQPAGTPCNPPHEVDGVPRPCPPFNSSLVGRCLTGGTLAFCGYAGMQSDGYPSDDYPGGPRCSLTGQPVPFAPPGDPVANPVNAYTVQRGADFSCFNSSKQGFDRLCIPRAYVASIDCVAPHRPDFLARILAVGEADFAQQNDGRKPQFQCFHRGGYGSVAWLHLHSFDGHADSICPMMSTREGASPNPLPKKIVCANGEAAVPQRVQQMLASMARGS